MLVAVVPCAKYTPTNRCSADITHQTCTVNSYPIAHHAHEPAHPHVPSLAICRARYTVPVRVPPARMASGVALECWVAARALGCLGYVSGLVFGALAKGKARVGQLPCEARSRVQLLRVTSERCTVRSRDEARRAERVHFFRTPCRNVENFSKFAVLRLNMHGEICGG